MLGQQRDIRLGQILRDNRERGRRLELHAVALLRGGQFLAGPDEEALLLKPHDRLLMAGAPSTQYRLDLTLRDEQVLSYVMDGIDRPDGLIWRWLASRSKS